MKIRIWNMPVRVSAAPNNVPLGVWAVVAAIEAEERHVSIEVQDLNQYRPSVPLDSLHSYIAAKPVDLEMFSGLITTFKSQRHLANVIRGVNPKAKIVSGGGLATNIGEELCDWIPIDAVCIGEGDIIAPRIVRDARCDGLSGGLQKVYHGIPADMDKLAPIDWDRIGGIELYIRNPIWGAAAKNSSATRYPMKRSMNFVSSRGCPHSCKFCSRDTLGGRNYRAMSPRAIGEQILNLLERYTLDWIGFVDDNFLARPYREISELLSWLSRFHEFGATWGAHSRFDAVDDAWLLDRLHDGACRYLGFGGESANEEILDSMNKHNKPEQMMRVIEMCREAGIHPGVTWMMGWPGETRLQVRDTAQFILSHAADNKCMFVATAYPGTELWEMVKDKILDKFGSVQAYVEQLEDATKPVINFSAMSDSEFAEVRAHIDAGALEKI